MDTQEPASAASTFKTRITSLFSRFPQRGLILLAVFGLIMLGITGYLYGATIKKQSTSVSLKDTDNVLLILYAKLDKPTSPSSITVKFNHPVDVHDLTHFVALSPQISGKWAVPGNDKTVLRFSFTKKYSGQNIYLAIQEGLKSTSNKTLLTSYYSYLAVSTSTEKEPYSRVKSYPVGKSIPLPDDASNIRLYKSNTFQLLSFLRYENIESVTRGSVYDGKFTEETTPHADSEKLTNLRINTEDNTILIDPGVYYIESNTITPYFIVVNNFGVVLRQDDKQVILQAFTLKDGKKIAEPVTYGMYNLQGNVTLLKDFTANDTNPSAPLVYPTRLDVIISIYKDEIAFVPVELPTSNADIQVSSNLDTDSKMVLYTDRPIYKPGDTVFVRGIIRQDSDSQYKVPTAGQSVYIRHEFKQYQFATQSATLDEYGTFSTQFVLPKDYESPYASIQASSKPFAPNDYNYTWANFEVLKYTKPEFEIKTAVEKPEYLRSDTLQFTISGNYFDGKPMQNKEVSYTLYTDNYYEVEKAVYNKNFNITSQGGMCGGGGFYDYFGTDYKTGTVTLDSKGEARLDVSPDDKTLLSQKITLVAKVTDNNKNDIISAANTIAHAADHTIFFIPSAERYSLGDEIVVPFYSEKLAGDKMKNTIFSYKLVDYEYTPAPNASKEQPILASGNVTTDESGKGIITFVIPKDKKPGYKQLIVSGRDAKSNIVQNQKSISILTPEEKDTAYNPSWGGRISQTYLKISSNQNSFKVNDTVQLLVTSPKELDVLLTYERGRIYAPRILHLNKGNNNVSFKVTEALSPSITAVFSFFTDGQYYTEGLSLNVPAMHKVLQINATPNKSIYSPNETADLLITTKDASGAPVAAQMSVGVVDKAIYALRKSATPPIHSSFYYFRPRRTNASSSLTGMGLQYGGGGGGGGGGAIGSTADILYWNPNLRTDATGEVRIPIPLLGHKTIWKVQVMGSTITSDFGQTDTEFTVTSEVKGLKTKQPSKKR